VGAIDAALVKRSPRRLTTASAPSRVPFRKLASFIGEISSFSSQIFGLLAAWPASRSSELRCRLRP
jgi:hypothetical protein